MADWELISATIEDLSYKRRRRLASCYVRVLFFYVDSPREAVIARLRVVLGEVQASTDEELEQALLQVAVSELKKRLQWIPDIPINIFK